MLTTIFQFIEGIATNALTAVRKFTNLVTGRQENTVEETQPVVEVKGNKPNFQGMNSAQLREQCKKFGIAWRNIHGKNKHLKKAEMVQMLLAV